MNNVSLLPGLSSVELKWLGVRSFRDVLDLQETLCRSVYEGHGPVVVACEHPPVITLGKRSAGRDDVLWGHDELSRRHIDLFNIDRGGHGTFHNPGQLVLYPILPLKRWNVSVRDYVGDLEEATAEYLKTYSLDVQKNGLLPGLWCQGRKIASFGIRVKRGVSLHGAAINVCNDLSDFSCVRPCAMDTSVTSIKSQLLSKSASTSWDLEQESQKWFKIFLSTLKSCCH